MLTISLKLFVNLIYCAAAIFLQIQIIINVVVNTAVLIVVFVFSDKTFGNGWTESSFCLPRTQECIQASNVIRIMRIVSASTGTLIG